MKPALNIWNKWAIVCGILAFILSTATIVLGENGKSGIIGRVLLGPTCPVIRADMQEQCKDKPFKTTLAVLESGTDREITRFDSDEDGVFEVIVPPGDYIIASLKDKILPRCSEPVKVNAGQFTDVVVHCDTGIR